MHTSYLFVTVWEGGKIKEQFPYHLYLRSNGIGKKAEREARAYELRLNGDIDYRDEKNLIEAIKNNKIYYTVCAEACHMARESRKFLKFEKAPFFTIQ